MSKCSVKGCDRKHYAKGYCRLHYDRVKANGSPDAIKVVHKSSTPHKGPTYNSWCLMKNRCYCKTATSYPYYGGRGIKVCSEWLGVYGYENFVKDMGERPQGTTLDRVDPTKDYCKENCRWADIYTQTANRNIKKTGGDLPTGVYYRKDRKTWVVTLTTQGEEHRKYFTDKQSAIRYRKKLEQLYL